MTVPRYSRTGFAGVARMTRARYTAFVEGKHHDAVYYDRLLNESPALSSAGVRIMRSTEVSDAESAPGGKSAVLALHDHFDDEGSLSIPTNDTTKHMVFLLDRDYDQFELNLRESKHVIYTEATDVEAEIYRQGDLGRALATVFSLTTEEVEDLVAEVGNFAFELAIRWREWITMCIAAGPMRSRCAVAPSRPSRINVDLYGNFDAGAYSQHRQDMITTSLVENPEEKLAKVTEMVDEVYEDGDYFKLLKGKLIPGFVVHLVSSRHPVNQRDLSAKANQLTLAMLDSANYATQAKYHETRFLALDA